MYNIRIVMRVEIIIPISGANMIKDAILIITSYLIASKPLVV